MNTGKALVVGAVLGFVGLQSAQAGSVSTFMMRLSDGTQIDGSRPFDLQGKDLVINTTAANRQVAFDWINQLVQEGRGFTDSTIGGSPLMNWVAVLNDNGAGAPLVTRFADQAVDASSILVKYTWRGDVNLDGEVNLGDYFIVDSGYLGKGRGYAKGDVNLDGEINLNDYFLVDSAYLNQRGGLLNRGAVMASVVDQSPSHDPQSVPMPPAVWGGMGLIGAVVVGRRIRR